MKLDIDSFRYSRETARQFMPLENNDRESDEIIATLDDLNFTEDQLDVLWRSGAELMLYAVKLQSEKRISSLNAAKLAGTVNGLIRVMLRVERGDELAQKQLDALDKVLYPGDYDFDRLTKVVAELANGYDIPITLVHGRRIKEIMRLLEFRVEQAEAEPGRRRERQRPFPRNVSIRPKASRGQDVRQYWRPDDTLETLAIRIYQETHNLPVTEIKEALQVADKWEADHPEFPNPMYAIESFDSWIESKNAKGEKFRSDVIKAIIQVYNEKGKIRHEIALHSVAGKLNMGNSKNNKNAANNLLAKLTRYGITKSWRSFVEETIDAYLEEKRARSQE
jgi:hypothetical protein